jgi:hypothetical protein
MIFACLHWSGGVPSSKDARKTAMTQCLTTGHTCFQTITGSPSSPGVFHDFAANSCHSTSSSVGDRHGSPLRPRAFVLDVIRQGREECGQQLFSLFPVVRRSCPISPEQVSFPDFKYLAASQMLSLSARNSSQCLFFCS